MNESKAHFGAWAVVSSPLTLGHDLSNDAQYDAAWPVISNRDAIRVNQVLLVLLLVLVLVLMVARLLPLLTLFPSGLGG